MCLFLYVDPLNNAATAHSVSVYMYYSKWEKNAYADNREHFVATQMPWALQIVISITKGLVHTLQKNITPSCFIFPTKIVIKETIRFFIILFNPLHDK